MAGLTEGPGLGKAHAVDFFGSCVDKARPAHCWEGRQAGRQCGACLVTHTHLAAPRYCAAASTLRMLGRGPGPCQRHLEAPAGLPTDLKPAGKLKVLWVPRTGQVARPPEAGMPSPERSTEPALSLHPPRLTLGNRDDRVHGLMAHLCPA